MRVVTNGGGDVTIRLTVLELVYVALGGVVLLAAIYGPLFLTWQDLVTRGSAIQQNLMEQRTKSLDRLERAEDRLDRLRYDICEEHPTRCGPTAP